MSQVNARLYCHGLGDCNLLGIAKPGGGRFWILIDCGIHSSATRGPDRVAEVVGDIAAHVVEGLPPGAKPRLDIIVQTHEHWDHNSGFLTAADAFAQFDVGAVWMAWTENGADDEAKKLDKFKGNSLAALAAATVRLRDDPRGVALADGVDALLGFDMGMKGERSRDARNAVKALAPDAIAYLEPGTVAPLPDGLGVTAYVLGPPRGIDKLGVRDSSTDTYGFDASLAASFALAAGDLNVDDDPGAPFDDTEGERLSAIIAAPAADNSRLATFVREHYSGAAAPSALPKIAEGDPDPPGTDQQWRRIDSDWLAAAATLALQLDDRTNNTSLVLAFDLGPAGKQTGDVLLFAADAQVGNWQSWADVKFPDGTTGPDLVRRTRFYKVGHHGSANATLKGKEGGIGLEAMTHPRFEAFIPTDEVMAKKVGWGAIPEPALVKRLGEKAGGGVVQSDKTGVLFKDYAFGAP